MQYKYKHILYTYENLIKTFSENTEIFNVHSVKIINSNYLRDYLETLGAKTIILENKYIDHDYLDDFSGYYVRCFKRYNRACKRLHFFSLEFSDEEFKKLLGNEKSKITKTNLNNSYLGFIVIKPLPQTIIGRTCLKTYGSDNGRRFFPILRECSANLFGINLSVQSIPFQEQDTVVSACATSALWSVFQSTGKLYQHPILTPLQITKIACDSVPGEARYLPNNGLTIQQMAHAIRAVGLEPNFVQAIDQNILRSNAYSYLAGGNPAILTVILVDTSEMSNTKPAQFLGLHAIALTGYSLGRDHNVLDSCGLNLKAYKIDKLYGHDDQIGPFARIILDGKKIKYDQNGQAIEASSIQTSWSGKNGIPGSVRAIPDILFIPVYEKIRIPFEVIQDEVIYFNRMIEFLKSKKALALGDKLQWDIHLITVNEFRSNFLDSSPLPPQLNRDILLFDYPRFMWRATATLSDKPILDLLFDATEIEQGLTLYKAIGYDSSLFNALVVLANLDYIPSTDPVWKTLTWFKNQEPLNVN